jgi:hypothetical protein
MRVLPHAAGGDASYSFSCRTHRIQAARGADDSGGLALACDRCNAYKGPKLTSIDPETGIVTALFNPRGEVWSDRFAVQG